MEQIVWIWSLACLAVAVALFAAARRLGEARTASWLVLLGLVMLAVEEPLLTLFWAIADPAIDGDGMATLITGPARAHVLDSAVLATGFLALLGGIAATALRRGRRWAVGVLAAGWVTVAVTTTTTAFLVYSRGLPLPGPGADAPGAGFGWEQLTVALLAWAGGLWLMRRQAR